MNQAAKIFIGISVTAAAMAAIMFSSTSSVFHAKKEVTDEDITDEFIKHKPKKQTAPPENIPLLIQGVRDLLKGTAIDVFDGATDRQFAILTGPELKSLAVAIDSKKKYSSESKFRAMEPGNFNLIMSSASKIKGRKILI